MKNIVNRIESLDAFGGFITFRINNRNKQKSILGGFITILIGLLFMFLSFLFSKDLFEKANPRINSIRSYNPDNISISLNNSKNLNMIVLLCKDIGSECSYQFNSSIFNLTADYVTVTGLNDSRKYEYTILKVDYCKKEDFGHDLYQKFDELMLSKALCVSPGSSEIYGQYESKVFKYIRIRLAQCTDNNINNITCISTEDVKKELGKWRMSFYYTFDLENVKKYDQPKLKYITNYGFSLAYDNFKRTSFFFQNNTLISDEGYWLENQYGFNRSIITYDSKYDEFQYNTPSSTIFFANVFIRVSPIQIIFQRVYKKFPNVFAEVIGIINYTCIFLIIFFSFYNTFILKIHLFNFLDFDLPQLKKKEFSIQFDTSQTFTLFNRKTIDRKTEMDEVNSNDISRTESLNEKNYIIRKKVNCFKLINNYICFCRKRKKGKKELYEIYEEINEIMIKKLDVFHYISLQNKFYYLCKFVLDDDQYILFNNLDKPFLFLNEKNEIIGDDFTDKQENQILKNEAFNKIYSKPNKSKIDNLLLYLNRNISS